MNEKQMELKSLVERAISKFNLSEIYLLDKDLSERCICSKFATYLEKELINTRFSNYIVDVEYNRGMEGNGYAKKMLFGKNMTVDIIVHKRGYDKNNGGFDNLICFEMKKSDGDKNLFSDKRRLTALTDPLCDFNYRIGFMLIAKKTGIVIDDIFCNELDF